MELQGELKRFECKALVSNDKSIKLVFYATANDNDMVDINELHNLLLQPLSINICKSIHKQ